MSIHSKAVENVKEFRQFRQWLETEERKNTLSIIDNLKNPLLVAQLRGKEQVYSLVKKLCYDGDGFKDVKFFGKYKIKEINKKVVCPRLTIKFNAIKLTWLEILKKIDEVEERGRK